MSVIIQHYKQEFYQASPVEPILNNCDMPNDNSQLWKRRENVR